MTESVVWAAEPHTLRKHDILRRYLEAWFPILGRKQGRVVYLDAFAGPGIYTGGEPGSPIVALETLLSHSAFAQLRQCEFVFIFLEPHPERFTILQAEIAKLFERVGGRPENVRVVAQQMTFDEGASEILVMLGKQKADLAPTFAFIDPFGFKDTPLELICRLLNFRSCEVLFTFMFNHINWFIEKEAVAGHLEALFGTDGFQEAASKEGSARKAFIRQLFRRQLMSECGFEFVTSFEMVNQQGNPIYFLFYGTRSIRGLEVMKDSLWKVDPGGGVRFLDRLAGQEVLFGGANIDVGPLRAALLDRFSGQVVTVEDINRFVLTETPYNKSHWNQRVLKPLEQEGLVEAVTERRKRFTFPPGTQVRFHERRSPNP